MESKKLRVSRLVSEIEALVTTGAVTEKASNDISGCFGCTFSKACHANYKMPCMAHNRENKDSVYYVKAKKNVSISGLI